MAKRFAWSLEARADVRGMVRYTASRPPQELARYLKTEVGDVKPLHGFNPPLCRLWIGNSRFRCVDLIGFCL